MDKEKQIEPMIIGKIVQRLVEVDDGYVPCYRLYFSDGTAITFHGGSVGYDNGVPWYEVSQH